MARCIWKPSTASTRACSTSSATRVASRAIFVCPHGPESRCRCRPPLPGLFEEIAERLKINLSGVAVVAATDEEISAAGAAGAQPVRIAAGGNGVTGLPAFDSLPEFQ